MRTFRSRLPDSFQIGFVFTTITIFYFVNSMVGEGLLSHNAFDSYTKQAMAWLDGRSHLLRSYSYLELVNYDGKFYVSFPPLPSVVMAALVPFFGEMTPNNLVTLIYATMSVFVSFGTLRRLGLTRESSAGFALLGTVGSTLLPLSNHGGPWFQAQSMSFLLTSLAFYCATFASAWTSFFAFACLALAVGCRPFQIVYFPVLFLLMVRLEVNGFRGLVRSGSKMVLTLSGAAAVGAALAAYNYSRFGNPLQFGHDFLPEFVDSGLPKFSPRYIANNVLQSLRLPSFKGSGYPDYPMFDGFLFAMANPIYLTLLFIKPRRDSQGLSLIVLVGVCLVVHALLLLSHRTMGVWHFGNRFYIDLIPAIVFLVGYTKQRFNGIWLSILVFALLQNIYGALHWLRPQF